VIGTLVWIVSLLALGVAYASISFRQVPMNHQAISCLGKKIRCLKGPTWTWILWPVERFVLYPKVVRMEFPDFQVTTKESEYGDHRWEKVLVTVEKPTLYFKWPAGAGLKKAFKNLPGPDETEKIHNIFKEIIINTLRSYYSALTWQEISENPRQVYPDVLNQLREDKDMTNPFYRGGVEPIEVSVQGIKLPRELEEVISRPEAAAFRAKETVITAEATAKQISFVGEGEANARRAIFDAIRQGELPKEVLLTLREMAKGKSTKFVMLPPEILQVFQGVLGHQATSDELSRLLDDSDFRQKLLQMLGDSGESKAT
jgi:regulator of protease activity HflC (stomatin/prohibitin superfamily)